MGVLNFVDHAGEVYDVARRVATEVLGCDWHTITNATMQIPSMRNISTICLRG